MLKKSDVAARKNSSHVRAEKDILASTSSAHVVKLFYSFQSRTHLYLVCALPFSICTATAYVGIFHFISCATSNLFLFLFLFLLPGARVHARR